MGIVEIKSMQEMQWKRREHTGLVAGELLASAVRRPHVLKHGLQQAAELISVTQW